MKQLVSALAITALIFAAPLNATCSISLAEKIVEDSFNKSKAILFPAYNLTIEKLISFNKYAHTVTQADIDEFNQELNLNMVELFNAKKSSTIDFIAQNLANDQEAERYLELMNDPVMQKMQTLGTELIKIVMPTTEEIISLNQKLDQCPASKNIEAKIAAAKKAADLTDIDVADLTVCDENSCSVTATN